MSSPIAINGTTAESATTVEAIGALGPPVTAHIADLRSLAQRRIPGIASR